MSSIIDQKDVIVNNTRTFIFVVAKNKKIYYYFIEKGGSCMNRNELKNIAKQTIEISENKYYSISNKDIYFNTKHFYKLYEECPTVDMVQKHNKKANIVVKNESTIEAIHRMGNGVGVLNFASAKWPCGGFLGGSMAQEECLAYCSDLYIQQWPQAKEYYTLHRDNPNPFYTHTMFVNNVTFFRNADLNLTEDYTECKVLTSAAVNLGVVKSHGKSVKEANVIMKARMRKILKVFIDCNCKNIILGAFGCGVFENSAEDVAKFWRELLIDEGYQYYFDDICFSVLDSRGTNNFEIFRKTFE